MAALSYVTALTYNKKRVPYQIYFMSRNMEHALHGIADDLSDKDKDERARAFQQQFKDDLDGFKRFLTSSEVAVPGDDYRATWDYAKEGTHSLERGSNLHLFLN